MQNNNTSNVTLYCAIAIAAFFNCISLLTQTNQRANNKRNRHFSHTHTLSHKHTHTNIPQHFANYQYYRTHLNKTASVNVKIPTGK